MYHQFTPEIIKIWITWKCISICYPTNICAMNNVFSLYFDCLIWSCWLFDLKLFHLYLTHNYHNNCLYDLHVIVWIQHPKINWLSWILILKLNILSLAWWLASLSQNHASELGMILQSLESCFRVLDVSSELGIMLQSLGWFFLL